MNISQKCQYAVRALLELPKHHGNIPLKSGAIAARQAIDRSLVSNYCI
jgi:DNA-binding IscR family transcriptional regulator